MCSNQLTRIPMGLSPIDAVSISARMNDLEDTLKKLCESFDKFKSDNQPTPATSFANVASHPLGAVQRTLQGQNVAGITRQGPPGPIPPVNIFGPPQQSWADVTDQSLHVQGQGLNPQVGQLGVGAAGGQRSRQVSSKRSREESDGGDKFQFPRKPRKVTYGKSKVMVDGAEAAPVETFVGNTKAKATPEKITAVMKQCADELPEKVQLEILEVKCLANFDLYPNARTKCWKLTVPYKFKELMMNEEIYPAGWSNRQFYPPRQNKAKRQKEDGTGAEASGYSGSSGSAGSAGASTNESMVGAPLFKH